MVEAGRAGGRGADGRDPWAPLGLLRIGALKRWSIWLDSAKQRGARRRR
jgi:hypothetical protein